jgi:hypothetical protein
MPMIRKGAKKVLSCSGIADADAGFWLKNSVRVNFFLQNIATGREDT